MAEADLQRGENYLVHRGKVGFPQHLGPLSEGQDSLVSYCSHCGWHLRTKDETSQRSRQRNEERIIKKNREKNPT